MSATSSSLPTPRGREFGRLRIDATTVRLLVAHRSPSSRGWYLHEDAADGPAVEFGPDPDPQTVANGIASMVMLLGLAPTAATR
jgi:hypothetical protein